MGISFEHQVGPAIGLAAYAAGKNKSRQRTQKYAMDLFRDDRRLQARRDEQFQGFKYRGALQGMRGIGGGQRRIGGRAEDDVVSGGRTDPMDSATSRKDRFRIERQRIANKQARRNGKPVPFPDAEIKDEPIVTRGDRDRARKKEDEQERYDRGREDTLEDKAAARQHARDMEIENDLQSGDLVLNDEAAKQIRVAETEFSNWIKNLRPDEEQIQEAREKLAEKIRQIKRYGTKVPDDTPFDIANKRAAIEDPITGEYRKPGPGEKATGDMTADGYVAREPSAEDAAAAAAETPMGKMEGLAKIHGMRGKYVESRKHEYLTTGPEGGFNSAKFKEVNEESKKLYPDPATPTEMPRDLTPMQQEEVGRIDERLKKIAADKEMRPWLKKSLIEQVKREREAILQGRTAPPPKSPEGPQEEEWMGEWDNVPRWEGGEGGPEWDPLLGEAAGGQGAGPQGRSDGLPPEPGEAQSERRISPDGKWEWNGSEWVKIGEQ